MTCESLINLPGGNVLSTLYDEFLNPSSNEEITGVTPVIWTVRGLKLEHRFLVFLVFSHCALKNDFHKCPIGDDLMLGG
jgi:hypothetical protein